MELHTGSLKGFPDMCSYGDKEKATPKSVGIIHLGIPWVNDTESANSSTTAARTILVIL